MGRQNHPRPPHLRSSKDEGRTGRREGLSARPGGSGTSSFFLFWTRLRPSRPQGSLQGSRRSVRAWLPLRIRASGAPPGLRLGPPLATQPPGSAASAHKEACAAREPGWGRPAAGQNLKARRQSSGASPPRESLWPQRSLRPAPPGPLSVPPGPALTQNQPRDVRG